MLVILKIKFSAHDRTPLWRSRCRCGDNIKWDVDWIREALVPVLSRVASSESHSAAQTTQDLVRVVAYCTGEL